MDREIKNMGKTWREIVIMQWTEGNEECWSYSLMCHWA